MKKTSFQLNKKLDKEIILDFLSAEEGGVDMLRTIHGERLVSSTDIIISNAFEEEYAHDLKGLGIEEFIPKTHLSPSRILDRVVSRYVTPSHVGESFINSVDV